MLISYNWLKKYIPELDKVSKADIVENLTTKLAEVEYIKPIRQELKNIVVGEVLEANKIEGSKNLTHTKVKISDTEIKDIICGANNVRVDIKVAVCLPQGEIYNAYSDSPKTISIGTKTMFNITSNGMICSEKELGISNNHDGILILDSELEIGKDLTNLLKDYIFEIENKSLSNRPDCFSHKGIARELASIFNLEFIDNNNNNPIIPTNNLELEFVPKLSEKDCERFSLILLSDLTVKDSPLWLKVMLESIGIRSINNVVDISNYIMLDIGQPLHIYYYDKFNSKKLILRYAKDSEKIQAIDNKEYKLNDEIIVIASESNIEGVAGIIGGKNTEIDESTRNIIIEAANFNMYSIRKASRSIGFRSEASTRFEKGQDVNLIDTAINNVIPLICDITGAEIASEINDYYPNKKENIKIDFDLTLVNRFLGIDLTVKEIIDYLEKAGCSVLDEEKIANVTGLPDNNLPVTVLIPSYRKDLIIKQDLLREIARLYGYDKFKPTYPNRNILSVSVNKNIKVNRRLLRLLTSYGFDEITTYSFLGSSLYQKLGMDIKDCLKIVNPLSPDLEYLRNSLIPNLIDKLELNSKKYKNIRIFETGRVVFKSLNEEGIHDQPNYLSGLCSEYNNDNPFYIIKGVIEEISSEFDLKFEYKNGSNWGNFNVLKPIVHNLRSASILLDNEIIGVITEIHPKITDRLGIRNRVGVFEINISKIINKVNIDKKYIKISPFQSIKRDLSYWVNSNTMYGSLIEGINTIGESLIKNVELVDVYYDKEDSNRKSITITIELQSDSKTLTDIEINEVINNINSKLKSSIKAELRS